MSDDAASAEGLEPGLLSAAGLLQWRRGRGQLAGFVPPEGVILTHQLSLYRTLTSRWRHDGVRLTGELRFLPGSDGKLAVIGDLGVGGPATAAAVEELAALGVRQVIAIDVAGSLDAGFSSGAVVLVEAALCHDGTSRHYARGPRAFPNASLSTRLGETVSHAGQTLQRGVVWSTDAPYRETADEIEAACRLGASIVDMETAALYAAGTALGIETASVLVVADQLFDGWQPPADTAAIQATLRRLAAAARACLTA